MRRLPRLLIFLGILLLGNVFVTATWIRFTGGGYWGLSVGIFSLAYAFIPTQLLGFRTRHPILRMVAIPSSIAFGIFSFSFVAAIACWIVAGAAAVARLPLNHARLAQVAFAAAILAVVYGIANASWIRITRYRVGLANLPDEWRGRTLALVTDMHLGNIRGPRFSERVVSRLNELGADIVLISGDMFDGARVDLQACVQPWRSILAPEGAYFVSGNHDEFSDSTEIVNALRAAGVRVVDNEKILVGGLQLIGVHDNEGSDPEVLRKLLGGARIDRSCACVLLNHRPGNLKIAEEAGVSLQLSGHTHLGQFWPWSMLVRRIYGPFAYGLNRLGSLQVVTSSGVGTWGPPVRVATRSEIVAIEFT
jgi:hypothetical protein